MTTTIRILIIALIGWSATCLADIAAEPWPKKLQDIATKSDAVVQGFRITVREAQDQSAGGSGGPVCDFTIHDPRNGAKQSFTSQSLGVVVLEFHLGWPQLEVWGRAGGGYWSRVLYRFTGQGYEYVRIDDFTVYAVEAKDKTRTTTRAGSGERLYYLETRLP